MPALNDKVKKVAIDNTEYEISAKYIQNGDEDMTWNDIKNLVEVGFQIVVLTTLPEANATSYETYHNSIVLIQDSTSITGSYVEYVIQRKLSGSSYTYAWERIGTTDTDLSNYVKKGTYTTNSAYVVIGGAQPEGELDAVYTDDARYYSSSSYDSTRAKIYTPIKTSEVSAHTHSVTLPIISASFNYVTGGTTKYLYKRVDINGEHSHSIDLQRDTVVASWSATISNNVLSFSVSTVGITHATPSGEDPLPFVNTNSAGSHYHTLMSAASSSATSGTTLTENLRYYSGLTTHSTFTLYYVGTAGSTTSISADVSSEGAHSHTMNTASYSNTEYYVQWDVPFSIRSHDHNYQHVHGAGSHTHSVDLSVSPASVS